MKGYAVPDPNKLKFFATFPYPYSNGLLHLGHGFTVMKVDSHVKFKKITGHNILFPFAFHTTGMPIKAAADKLKDEIAIGINENTPRNEQQVYQFHILMDMNIPCDEIPKFVNYHEWFAYFPQKGVENMKEMGLSVDWRRSFITTSENPYYSKFVEWYMNKLKDQGYIKYGKQYTVWSVKDGQVCSDHARKVGEGVRPTKHTMAKVRIANSLNCHFGARTYLVAIVLDDDVHRTRGRAVDLLRSRDFVVDISDSTSLKVDSSREIGNYVISDQGNYGVFELTGDDFSDYIICDNKTAQKLAYQGQAVEFGIVNKIAEIKPHQLAECQAMNVSNTNWSSIRISGKCSAIRWISTAEGERDSSDSSDSSTERVSSVSSDSSTEWLDFYDLDTPVITRSGDHCLVAYVDQWVVDYANKQWKELVRKHIENNMIGNSRTKQDLMDTVEWLHEKSIGRDITKSIGTPLPWDKTQVIDSLCDSTVYMMYYTIAHYLHKDMYGREGILPIDGWTTDVMDYIFSCSSGGTKEPLPFYFSSKKSENRKLFVRDTKDMNVIRQMHNEFIYWYPLDLRVSGKDLIRNHLTFCLFQHVALVGSSMSPKEFRVNGHIMIDNKKMSKSEGNFITLESAFSKYGVDATRFTLAYAGDDCNNDANFETTTAISMCNKLEFKKQWIREFVQDTTTPTTTTTTSCMCTFFIHRMKMCFANAKKAYECGKLKDVCHWGFFELEKYRKHYELFCDAVDYNIFRTYIIQQAIVLYPIIPFFSKYVFEETCYPNIDDVQFPSGLEYSNDIILEADFYSSIWCTINQIKSKTDVINITFVKQYPDWVSEINKIIVDNTPSKMKDVAFVLNKFEIHKNGRRSIMTIVKEGKMIPVDVHVDLKNVEKMLEKMQNITNITIHYEIIDQHTQIIPTQPRII